MSDLRPRPQYGEYATPEAQAQAMGRSSTHPAAAAAQSDPAAQSNSAAQSNPAAQPSTAAPYGAMSPEVSQPTAPQSAASRAAASRAAASRAAPSQPAAPQVPYPQAARIRKPGQANLIITVTLLALGLLNVATSIGNYINLPQAIQSVYNQLGYGTYTSIALASSLGVVVIVLSIVIWLATAAISSLVMRKHRISWWIPLVGATLHFIAIAIVMSVAVLSDPAFTAYIDKIGA